MRHFAMLWTILLCAAPSCVPAVANPLNTWIDASNQVTAALPFATTSMEEEASTILHVAMFEAMNTISRAYRPYHFSATVPTACDEEAAASAAGYSVLVGIFPSKKALLDKINGKEGSGVQDSDAIRCGRQIGTAAARDILHLREGLQVDIRDAWRPVVAPGRWSPLRLPVYGDVRISPWAISHAELFMPPRPPKLSSSQWADEFNEVKSIGRIDSTARTAEQTAAATFWENGVSLKGLRLRVMDLPDMTLMQKARLYALFSMIDSDTSLVVRLAKNRYRFWRPVVAIRNGDRDGNAKTQRDPYWLPLGDGSNTGEYPCGHCAQAAAIRYTFLRLIGHDLDGGFDLDDGDGKKRHYESIAAMADEESNSRIWLGAHFRGTAEVTDEMTKRISNHVIDSFLQPAR